MTTLVEIAPPPSPFKGLAPFDDSELDAFLFFGRTRETAVVAANVLASRLTILYGPSGVGKSSLLRAGVVRTLRAEPGFPRPAVVVYGSWAGDALAGLHDASFEAVSESLGHEPAVSPGGLADSLAAWSAELGAEICLLLDQLEELFLYHPDEGAGGFADLLPQLVSRPGLRVNVLLGIRDDALSQLDVFRDRIPKLFGNALRLDHLDREAGRAAILGPLECYAALAAAGGAVAIEPDLVDAVLDEVAAGRIEPRVAGQGGVELAEVAAGRIETPYLQLVLQRVWDVERERRSNVMQLATFRELGGAQRIVEDHLDRALRVLTPAEQDAAANVFGHLVTPSGTKIAHGVSDLASYAALRENDLEPVLRTLASQRILRPLGENGHAGGRYEIFHDVLAGAVLAWSTRHEADAALARERERRHRLAWLAVAALIALAAMTALAVYAFTQRGEAQEQAAVARSERAEAEEQTALANSAVSRAEAAEEDAKLQARRATRQESLALAEAEKAENLRVVAENEKKNALAAQQQATDAAARAAQGEASAEAAKENAEEQANIAQRAKQAAEEQTLRARRATANAVAARRNARARELVARSLAALAIDPVESARLAVEASKTYAGRETENALRAALVALRLEHILPGTGAGSEALARYSGDGSRIVVGGGPREVRVYRAADAQLLRTFRADALVADAALSPNGRLLAAGGVDGRIRVWEVDSRALRATLNHEAKVRAVAWSPRGDVLASVGTGPSPSARLWNAGGSSLPIRVLPHPRTLHTVSFSNDGRRLVTTGEGRIARVWDVASGDLLASPEHETGEITSAAFSPSGDHVVTGGRDRVARIWDAATGDSGHTLGEHQGQVVDVAFAPNGRSIATASAESVGRLFDVASGNLLNTLGGHAGPPLNDIAFSPDSTALVTAGADHNARHFGADQLPVALLGHQDEVTEASFDPRATGRVLTGSRDGQARIWDPNAEPRVGVRARHPRTVTSVAVSPDGSQVASGSADGLVQVSSIGGRLIRRLPLGVRVVRVAWGPRGLLLAATSNGVVKVWSEGGATLLREIRHRAALRDAALSGNGAVVATAAQDRTVRLWRLPSGELLEFIRQSGVTSVALDKTGGLVATASGQTASLWDWESEPEEPIHKLEGHTNTISDVTFNSTGTLLATSSADRTAQVWDVKTGKREKRFVGHSSSVAGVAFSPDSRWLVTAGPIKAGVWQVGDSDLPRNFLFFLAGYDQPLTSVAFSKRDWTIVSGSNDGTVRSYKCVYCGRLGNLVRFANTRLRRLRAEARR